MRASWRTALTVAACGLVVLLSGSRAHADETTAAAIAAARAWRAAHEHEIVAGHQAFVRNPSVSRDLTQVRSTARHLLGELRQRGLDARLLEVPDGAPLVYAEKRAANATATYVFYAHYDGQPVDPAEWTTPPFEPVLRSARHDQGGVEVEAPPAGTPFDPEWRLYGRASADDKAPITAMLTALDALAAAGIAPRANLKFVFDGEEEIGSPHLPQLLDENAELLRGDLWVICDGPEHPSGRTTVVLGVRGVVGVELTVYAANRELHSGHYGNWAPNPAMMLAQLLASMKEPDGRVRVAGFYDGVADLTAAERAAIEAIPDNDAEQMRKLSLARTEGGGRRLAELINLPSLNVRGIASGHVGAQAANVVPSRAQASLDIRLVKGVTPDSSTAALIRHIEREGYFVTDQEPDAAMLLAHPKVARVSIETGGYNATRTPVDLPVAQRLIATLEQVRPPLVLLPTMGGSLPLAVIEERLRVPTITVATVNADNNQHSRDENLRIGNLWTAIDSVAALLVMP